MNGQNEHKLATECEQEKCTNTTVRLLTQSFLQPEKE